MAHHIAAGSRSDVIISRIKDKRNNVRSWHCASGELVGIWQTRGGKTAAVGHNRAGKVILYRAMSPQDEWKNGPGDCVNPVRR